MKEGLPIQENFPSKEREIQREKLYQNVEQKIQAIIDVRKFIESIAGLDSGKFNQECQNKLNFICRQFDDKEVEGAKKLPDLLRNDDQTKERLYSIMDEMSEDELLYSNDNKEYNKLDRLSNKLSNQISHLMENDNIVFLHKMMVFFDNIKNKREQAIAGQKDYQLDKENFFKNVPINFEKDGVNTKDIEVQFSGCNIFFILKPDEYKKLKFSRECDGFHKYSTVYSVIQDTPEVLNIKKHEENHNLSESFTSTDVFDDTLLEAIEERSKRYQELLDKSAPKDIISYELSRIKSSIENYAYKQYHELVADIDSIAEGKIHTYLIDFLKSIESIKKYANKQNNDELKETIASSVNKMTEEFSQVIFQLSGIFSAAKKIDKIDEAKGALILFKHHGIKRVDRHLCSYKNFEIYKRLTPIINEAGSYFSQINTIMKKTTTIFERTFDVRLQKNRPQSLELIDSLSRGDNCIIFFDFINIKKLVNLLKDNQDFTLSQKEKELFEENFFQYNFSDKMSEAVATYSYEQLIQMDTLLKYLAERLNLPFLADAVETSLIYQYTMNRYEIAIKKDNFSELLEFYNQWPLKKDELNEALLDRLDEHVFEDYLTKHDKEYDEKSIKKSNYWKFLAEIGLIKNAQNYIRKDTNFIKFLKERKLQK